jgi:D-alanyl-D-alanine carboxypeptidase (penicillin-binding protein 5/6)
MTTQAQIPAQPELKRDGFQIQNQNQLIDDYPGAMGGKTGFTDLARHTYVGAAANGQRRLVVTLLGAENRPLQGWQQGAALLDWGFSLPADASVGRLVQPTADQQPAAPAAGPIRNVMVSPGTTGNPARAIAITVTAVGIALLSLLWRRRTSKARVKTQVPQPR